MFIYFFSIMLFREFIILKQRASVPSGEKEHGLRWKCSWSFLNLKPNILGIPVITIILNSGTAEKKIFF